MTSNYTIKREDTLGKIFKENRKYGLKSEDDIWKHKHNEINRIYWPEGVETPKTRLPEGHPLYLPRKAGALSGTVTKDKPKQSFALAPTLKNLRLKINFYDNFDVYGWLDHEHWKTHNMGKNHEEKYRRKNSTEWMFGHVGLASPEIESDANSDSLLYMDYDKGTTEETREFLEGFSKKFDGTLPVIGDLKSGQFLGDNTKVQSMKNGFVYVFKREAKTDPCSLIATFKVSSESYKKLTVTKADDSHTDTGGESKQFLEIENFFPHGKDILDETKYKEHFIYTSSIPLTWNVLCEGDKSIAKRIDVLGAPMPQLTWLLKEKGKPQSSVELHEDFNNTLGKGEFPDQLSFHINIDKFKNYINFNMVDPEFEAVRRNKIYQDYYADYVIWKDKDSRSEKSFLYNILRYLVKEGTIREGDLDQSPNSNFTRFVETDNKQYTKAVENFHFAACDLTNFLLGAKFKQVIVNYVERIKSENKKKSGSTADDLITKIFDLLAAAHKNLNFSPVGNAYFTKVWLTKNSFYNLLFSSEAYDLPKEFFKSDLFVGDGVYLGRKVTESFYTLLDEMIPIVLKHVAEQLKTKSGWKDKLHKVVQSFTSAQIKLYGLRPGYRNMLDQIDPKRVTDIKYKRQLHLLNSAHNKWKENPRFGKITNGAAIGFSIFESINAALLTLELANEEEPWTTDDWLNFTGAWADTVANTLGPHSTVITTYINRKFPEKLTNFFFKGSGTVAKKGLVGFVRLAPWLAIVGACIDAHLAFNKMNDAILSGDEDIALGQGMIGFGNLLAAAGTFTVIAAKSATISAVLSLGASAATVGALTGGIGLLVVLIGAAIVYFNDSNIQDWAQACYFGAEYITSRHKSDDELIGEQLNELFSMLVKFDIRRPVLLNFREFRYDENPNPRKQFSYASQFDIKLTNFRSLTNTSTIKFRNLVVKGKNSRWEYVLRPHVYKALEYEESLPNFELKLSDFIDENGACITDKHIRRGGARTRNRLKEKMRNTYSKEKMTVWESKNKYNLDYKVNLILTKEYRYATNWTHLRVRFIFSHDVDAITGDIGLDIMDSKFHDALSPYFKKQHKQLAYYGSFHAEATETF